MTRKHKTKQCCRCGKTKSLKAFYKTAVGPYTYCKMCTKERNQERYQANKELEKERVSTWREKNREKTRESAKRYYYNNQDKIQKYKEENEEAIAARKKAWRKSNPNYQHQYYLRNKERLRKKNNEYEKKRCAVDPCYKLKKNLRTRLYHALKGQAKNGSAVKDMGCTVAELKTYLESKFQPGMTWENYSIHGWHIDHIKPLADFDLSDRNELLKACHFTNLQPLWAEDNMRKNRYEKNCKRFRTS